MMLSKLNKKSNRKVKKVDYKSESKKIKLNISHKISDRYKKNAYLKVKMKKCKINKSEVGSTLC